MFDGILQFFQNLTPAISAFVSAVLVFLAAWLTRSLTRRQFVAQERLAWIKDIRALVAELCAICEQYDETTLPESQRAAFLKARNGILIRLSPRGVYDTDDWLIDLLADRSFQEVRDKASEIRRILTVINKGEWDKAKNEAGNGYFVQRKNKITQAEVNLRLERMAKEIGSSRRTKR